MSAVLICGSLFVGCSRKPAQTAPPPPEVLVTTVKPQDVPRVLERVATLDGFINANINAQVQGYIVSRDYQEGGVVKKGDLLFQIDSRPFEAALAQAKGTLAKDKANQVKADADEKRAMDLFNKKVISDQERDTAIAAAQAGRANIEADEAAVMQAELNLGYTRVISPIDGVAAIATAQVGDLVGPSTGTLTTVSQIDPIKAVVTAGEAPFTDFVTRHPDPTERAEYVKTLQFELILGNGERVSAKRKILCARSQSRSKDWLDPLRSDVSKSGKYFAARTVRKSAVRSRHQKGRNGDSAGSGKRVAGQLSGRRCRSEQQSQYSPGKNGRTHRCDVGSH